MPCGVFILWFCWFGFNGGSSLSLSTDASMTMTGLVCFNTNLAAAVATCVTMIFTWVRYGKPDVIVSKISVDSVVEAAKERLPEISGRSDDRICLRGWRTLPGNPAR